MHAHMHVRTYARTGQGRDGDGGGDAVHACAETEGKYQVSCSITSGLHVLAGPQAAGSRLKFACL